MRSVSQAWINENRLNYRLKTGIKQREKGKIKNWKNCRNLLTDYKINGKLAELHLMQPAFETFQRLKKRKSA